MSKKQKWLTIKEIAEKLGRAKSTVSSWCNHPQIQRERRGNVWYVLYDGTIKTIASEAKRKPKTEALRLPIRHESEIDKLFCPHCDSPKTRRNGYTNLTGGGCNVRMNCDNCFQPWSVALPHRIKPKDRRRKRDKNHRIERAGPPVPDTPERVIEDRRKWVREYIDRNVALPRILDVFGPSLKKEITQYYREFSNDIRES